MSTWTQITPLWEVNVSFETQAIPSWELITSLWKKKTAFRGAASDHSQAKQTSLLQRFEFFCKQGFKRTVSDSDYENTVKIIGCDSHDKRNSSFSEVSVTDGPAKVNLFRKPDLRRQYRDFRQPNERWVADPEIESHLGFH